MGYGYTGNILQVDLSNRKTWVEEQNDAFYRNYLGGRGIGYHYLLKEVPPGIDSFDPQNILTFATGVMTGSPLAASCRFSVLGKSPLTNTAGESETAGFFGPELKMAGFDAVVLRGRADTPVWLWMTDGKAEIRDATHLATLGAREVEDAIRAEMGSRRIRVAQTGLAGMNRVLFANITNNLGHFNGRNGLGAVMGAKNIRALGALGTTKLQFHDRDFLKRTAAEYARTFKDNPLGKALYDTGTTAFCELLSNGGGLPVDNFRRSALEDPSPVSAATYNQTLLQRRKGCYACPIQCKRGIALDHPKYGVDSRYGGPEYETMAALGTNLNIFDLKPVAKGNEICNRYCMDTISMGMTIAFACECYENKVITKADTGGLELRFGDADQMISLLEMTAHREGFGDLLAQGTARLAERWGVGDAPYNLTVKGQELPMHDPRIKVGVGIGYAISSYGADHMNAAHDNMFADKDSFPMQSVRQLGIERPVAPTAISADKVHNYARLDTLWKMMDALGLCVFGFAPRGAMPLDTMVACLNAITGWQTDMDQLMASSRRGSLMARAFNHREGFGLKDDRLPTRLFSPKPDGPGAGETIFEETDFDAAVRQYYELAGCDPDSGCPSRQALLESGLEWVAALLDEHRDG